MLVADGSLQNGQIVITSAINSGQNAYDAAGNLVMYTTVNGTEIWEEIWDTHELTICRIRTAD